MQTILGIIAVVVGAVLAFKLLVILIHGLGWLLGIAATVLWVGALVHIAFSQFSSLGAKVFWFVVVLFTHVFGAISYFLLGRPRGVMSRMV